MTRSLRALGILLTFLFVNHGAAAQVAVSNVVLDGTIGGGSPTVTPSGGGFEFEIHESLGARNASNLYHSLSHMDVAAPDTVLFSAGSGATISNLIIRVTGGRSFVDGTVRSAIPAADVFLVNPDGVVFGESARIDVPASFYLSSADELGFADDLSLAMRAEVPVTLSAADPTRFGFFDDDAGSIVVRGAMQVGEGETLALIGGDLTIDGGTLSSLDGHVLLASLAGAGTLELGPAPGAPATLTGPRGRIDLVDDALVTSSGLSPLIDLLASSADPESTFARLSVTSDPAFVPPGAIILSDAIRPDGRRVITSVFLDLDAPVFDRGAGRVEILARDLGITDSRVRADTVGSGTGSIEVDLTGDLTIEKRGVDGDVGVAARSGITIEGKVEAAIPGIGCEGAMVACRVVDPSIDLVEFGLFELPLLEATGGGGDIAIRAVNGSLDGGARIAATSQGRGAPGSIDLDFTGELRLEGLDPFPSSAPDAIVASAIVTNHQGRPLDETSREGGRIDIDADVLHITDQSGVFAQTTGDGHAGDIDIASRRLVLEGDAQIDSSTSGQLIASGVGTGNAGDIDVVAEEEVVLRGATDAQRFTRISTFSAAESEGSAGTIRIDTRRFSLQDGASIAVTTLGEGGSGSVEVAADTIDIGGHARLSASSESTIDPAGDVTIQSAGVTRLTEGARLTAETNLATGGNVRIESGDVLLVANDVVVSADAISGGSGGRVDVVAPITLLASSARISASAPGGPEFQGTVNIDSPIVNVDDQLRPPEAGYLDASSLLSTTCAARREGDRAGSLQVTSWPGVSIADDGPLLALDRITPATKDATSESAEPRLLAARGATRAGRHADAVGAFASMADDAQLDAGARGDALRGLGQARQRLGAFADAIAPLEEAVAIARGAGDARREASALGQLGNTLLAVGESARAGATLEAGVDRARAAGDPGTLALGLAFLGNHQTLAGDHDAAARSYRDSEASALAAGDRLRVAQVRANAAAADLARGRIADAVEWLDRARVERPATAREADGDGEGVELLVHLAERYLEVARSAPERRPAALTHAHRLALEASSLAGRAGDERARSRATGVLGDLYREEGGRDAEAAHLLARALDAAEGGRAPMLVVRWSRALARIAASQGDKPAAVAHGRRAVQVLDEIRPETRARYGASTDAFETLVSQTYLELVEDLLDLYDEAGEASSRQAILAEARDAVERWKAAELRDYFRDECVAELRSEARGLDDLAADAAVVYPILLRDRTELIVAHRGQLARYTTPVGREEVTTEARSFRSLVVQRQVNSYRRPARKLHRWLVEPYAERMAELGVDTLVFVPDGALRSVPFAALLDGRRFLVEDFAVAVTPSLELVGPKPLRARESKVLLAGLSEPVQGMEALEHVPSELEAIRQRFGGEVLLDEAFERDRLATALREGRPGIVHIASHAQFASDSASSYVLAHDGRISFEEMARLVSLNRFGSEPIELLLLSACETAAGDDRSALGLAGAAIRAGARSALGSLWRVNDDATARLMREFYARLDDADSSKADAFSQAQRELLAESAYDHPYYWSAFLIINNWL